LRRIIGEDIELVTVLDTELKSVKADPAQIEQILLNLAVNARDAMPQGGRLTIETGNVTLDETYANEHFPINAGNYVALAVSDTGCGMDAATQARIFEPFFTTKEAERGSGLGLSIVYGIVKQSEGCIWVDSEPGKGASFKIFLPNVLESRQVPETFGGSVASVASGSELIVIVEDDAAVRELITIVLRTAGYQVLEARGGDEALQLCRLNGDRIGLVLTDLVMPQMSGTLLAKKVKEANPQIAMLYISGYASDAVIRHGHLDPGVPFIQKPFTAGDLLKKIREALDRRTLGDAATPV